MKKNVNQIAEGTTVIDANGQEINEEVKATPKVSLKKVAVGLGIAGAIGFGILRVLLAGKGEDDEYEGDDLDDDGSTSLDSIDDQEFRELVEQERNN